MSTVDELLASGRVIPVCEVTAWLDGQALGVIPVAQGQVTETDGDQLGKLELTVPAVDGMTPTHPTHPLAPFGQDLMVRRGFALPDGGTIGWENLGRYRIWAAEPDKDGWITVEADSIDTRLVGARWVVDTRTSGSLATQARAIVAGLVPIRIDAPDRSISARTWPQQDSRLESLQELCDAWGTVLRMVDGQLTIQPAPTSTSPSIHLHTGPGGTITEITPEQNTDRVPNAVVAMTAPEGDEAPVQAMATITEGPRAWGSPYGQEIQFFASPLLRTWMQCRDAARTRLARLQASVSEITVTCLTDPRIRLGTVVRVTDGVRDTDVTIRATEVVHALTPGREPGTVKGTIISGRVEGRSWA